MFKTHAALLIIAASILCACYSNKPASWTVTGMHKDTALNQSSFFWLNDSIGNRAFTRTSMFINVRIKGLPYTCLFQFDLGSNITMIYGRNAASVKALYPDVDLTKPIFSFGDITATTKSCYISKDYGNDLSLQQGQEADTIQLGTIGTDMFQNKVLIIDYPHERFFICDTVPAIYAGSMTPITLDAYGRIILPMQINGKTYRVLFDNGSSIFQLKTSKGNIDQFTTEPANDTLQINAWGNMHNVIGRPLKGSILLAGHQFSDITVYEDHNDEASTEYDAITGNALFWNNTIIIDLKNKQFGIR